VRAASARTKKVLLQPFATAAGFVRAMRDRGSGSWPRSTGKLADIVIWDKDPIADIIVLQRPAVTSLIIKDGRIVDSEGGGFRQLSEEPPRARMFLAG